MGPAVGSSGRFLSFLSAKGGVGTSTLSCILGRAAAHRTPSKRIGLVDFSPPSSSLLPSWLRLSKTTHTLEQLASYSGRRTPALLEGYFSRSPEGLIYIPAYTDTEGKPHRGLVDAVIPTLLEELLGWIQVLLLDLSSLGPEERSVWLDRSHRVILVSGEDAASLSALAYQERRLLANHFNLDACFVWLNASRGGSIPPDPASLVPKGLKVAAVTPFLGADLSLRLMENPGLPSELERSFKPAVQEIMREEGPWRIPTASVAPTEGPSVSPPDESPAPSADLELAHRLHQRLLDHFRAEGLLAGRQGMESVDRSTLEPRAREALDRFIQDLHLPDRAASKQLVEETLHLAFGLGPLEPLVADARVTEIMVNGSGDVYVEKEGRLEKSPVRFLNEQQLRTVIERILAPIGRRIDESQPYVDGRLPDGSRINAVIPPISLVGPVLTIRKFAKKKLTIEDLIRLDSMTREAADFLGACVKARKNIVVSGGTGSGKTTLLNVLSGFIPESERIITIEDSAELRLSQEHVVRLEARPANLEGKGRISIRDLVINALRMRPDRIVVGEVRGGEALDMLQAMNTGHDGSLTTAHANSPRDALSRLETMSLMAGLELPMKAVREQIARAVHLVVQQSRLAGGKRAVTHISEVQGMDGDVIILQDLFSWDEKQGLTRRPFAPSFLKDLETQGYRLPAS